MLNNYERKVWHLPETGLEMLQSIYRLKNERKIEAFSIVAVISCRTEWRMKLANAAKWISVERRNKDGERGR